MTDTQMTESKNLDADFSRFLHTDVATLANNHLSDFGEESIKMTLKALEENHIAVSGVNDRSKDYPLQRPIILEKDGVRIGVLSYCINDQGCYTQRKKTILGPALYQTESSKYEIINLRKQNVNAVIVYFHWGEEYQLLQQSKNPQNKTIEEIAPYTDVIIGSHSHVIDGHLFFNDTLIVPNLGNLFFPMHQTPQQPFNAGEINKIPKKRLRHIKKMVKKYKNPSAESKLVRLVFNRNGLDRDKSAYMMMTLDVNNYGCFYIRKKSKECKWQQFCSKGDKQCYGDNDCNFLECRIKKQRQKETTVKQLKNRKFRIANGRLTVKTKV